MSMETASWVSSSHSCSILPSLGGLLTRLEDHKDRWEPEVGVGGS